MSRLSAETIMKQALQYQDALVAYAYAMLQDWASAEDTVQNALVVVMKKWEEFEPGSSVYAWVRRIVHLKTLETLRARSREVSTASDALQALVQTAMEASLDEARAQEQGRMIKALQLCMAEIGSAARDLITGFYRDRHSYARLAEIFGRTVESVRKMLYRTRRQLEVCTRKRMEKC